jgi:hypothetical protein
MSSAKDRKPVSKSFVKQYLGIGLSICDQNFWLLHPNSILTLVEVGMESVQATIKGNEKENFIVVAAVTATGNKFLVEFIASSKTICVERTQAGQVDEHWRSHSQNGLRHLTT